MPDALFYAGLFLALALYFGLKKLGIDARQEDIESDADDVSGWPEYPPSTE